MPHRPLLFVAAMLVASALPGAAQAHWCDDLWKSNYNLVVRPETDVLTTSGDLTVWVQNNMGYPLPSFKLETSQQAGGYTVTNYNNPSYVGAKRGGWLMPGEKIRVVFTVSGSGTLDATSLPFYATFGTTGAQQSAYPNDTRGDVVVRRNAAASGSWTVPSRSAIDQGFFGQFNGQSYQLPASARANFGDLGTALSELRSYFDDLSSCPNDGRYWYPRLWAAGELAMRARLSPSAGVDVASLRTALKSTFDNYGCGEGGDTARAYALFVIGYLGSGSASTLQGVIDGSATASQKDVARAALYLADPTGTGATLHSTVQTNASSSDFWVSATSAAALGVVDADAADGTVTGNLLPKVQWTEPTSGDNGRAIMAAHLLHLVAFARRGWDVDGADGTNGSSPGCVSFYEGCSGPGPGPGPTNGAPDCSRATVAPPNGVFPLTVTLDATPCTDPESQALTIEWSVALDSSHSLTRSDRRFDHVFDQPGEFLVTLSATDSGTPSQTTQRRFTIVVTDGTTVLGRAMGGCNCSSASGASLALGAILPAAGLGVRRRRG